MGTLLSKFQYWMIALLWWPLLIRGVSKMIFNTDKNIRSRNAGAVVLIALVADVTLVLLVKLGLDGWYMMPLSIAPAFLGALAADNFPTALFATGPTGTFASLLVIVMHFRPPHDRDGMTVPFLLFFSAAFTLAAFLGACLGYLSRPAWKAARAYFSTLH